MLFFMVKYVHLIGAAVLLGTGAGIAFFLLMAHWTGNPALIAGVARVVVIGDFVFTASAVVVQPITGIALAYQDGLLPRRRLDRFVDLSLFRDRPLLIAGRLDAGEDARPRGHSSGGRRSSAPIVPCPVLYLVRVWVSAFAAVLGIYWLMMTRPAIAWFAD